jgi:hypothetical protein
VTAPPLNATSSAGEVPPRAASATRAFMRTDTFIPMKPAAAEKLPPMMKPMATRTFSAMSRTTASTIPITPMIVYWRLR